MRGVDVLGTPHVTALDERHETGVRPQERACPGVAGRHADHLRPVHGGKQHRVARLAAVGGDRDRGSGLMGRDQAAHRLRPDKRLVGQGDHGGGDDVGPAA